MQRLFSSFADGWPGAGLLLLRSLAGGRLTYAGIMMALAASDMARAIPPTVAAAAGALLVVGLYTPIAGILVAVVEAWVALYHTGNVHTGNVWAAVVLMGIGLSLAMIGPGAWSVDARLFGRKQIDPSDFERNSDYAPK